LEQTGFPALYNTCKQLQENLRLTALEADESIHDVHLARQEFVNEKSKVMKMNRAIMNLYKDNKAQQKSNDDLELEVRSCKKEKIAILSGIRGYLNSTRRNEEAKQSHEYHNGPLSENLDETKENESISTSHTLDESINLQLTSFESASSIEAPTTPSSTCSSLITDDECATLRLAKRHGKPSTFSFLRGAIQATTNSCEVEFTSNPGLQFLRLPPNVIVDANMNPHLPVFLIYGFVGFRETNHQRTPSFGARLISIDSHSLEHEEWDNNHLVGYIKKRKGLLKMKFRNDRISDANMQQLKQRSFELSRRCS
jgi:hypothetical protein